jgi:hypothetical protein
MRDGYIRLPAGWSRESRQGFGPFVSREVIRRADGLRVVWESRWHRKHPRLPAPGTTWWAPQALGWWIAVLFALGSTCFALGSFPPFVTLVGANPDNLTYFIGSVFFTVAAFLQYDEVVSVTMRLDGSAPLPHRLRRLFTLQHRRIDWWAAIIQLAGTLWFNRTTLSALVIGLGASASRHPVWRPDAAGSICFLVSSWLSWTEECHGVGAWRPSDISWWITLLNLAGSIAFGVSAVASYVTPNGQLLSLALTNLGTFVGAVCFLVGSVLLLPERTATAAPGTGPRASVPASNR